MMSNCELLQLDEEMLRETPVPYYDMGVSCGLPSEMGDIPPEMMMAPALLTMGLNVSFGRAQGDSMIGVGIHDGDMLLIESTSHFNNQDIVLAKINGEDLLKTYYMDEHGRHWLVPANDKYDAILLTEDMDVRFAGRVVWNMRRDVHDTTRNIRQSIERYLDKYGEPEVQQSVEQVVDKETEVHQHKKKMDKELLARAIECCQQYFWGNVSYGVVFCICRDDYKKCYTRSDFEEMIEQLPYRQKRSYTCPAGTIANAFRNNPIFNEHISEWDKFNPLKRIIRLRDELQKELKL